LESYPQRIPKIAVKFIGDFVRSYALVFIFNWLILDNYHGSWHPSKGDRL